MGMHEDIELMLVARPILQKAVDDLQYLAGVLEWKRDGAPEKTAREIDLDILIGKLTRTLCKSNVKGETQK